MSDRYQLHLGDCLEVLKTLPDGSVDAVITDPPYGLSFMGKRWDASVPSVEVWQECLRVAKPGAHLLSFAGTRTQHRMAVAIEDAGWFIRDMIAWVYGSGFPKSLDVSKAIDKAAGAEREVLGVRVSQGGRTKGGCEFGVALAQDKNIDITAPATEAAKQWQGWGTALKPSLEPITLARKPIDGTVAANVLEHGTGALNVDGCRVGTDDDLNGGAYSSSRKPSKSEWVKHGGTIHNSTGQDFQQPAGRWPANLIHDGSEEVVGLFPETTSGAFNQSQRKAKNQKYGQFNGYSDPKQYNGDSGSAARFFYCAKASKADRDEGCEGLEAKSNMRVNAPRASEDEKHATRLGNHHPTVKPTDLMRYLCRLVTPPGGIVLDPFMGSGSTGKAAILEGFRFIGIELEPEYMEIAKRRIEREARQKTLDFGGEA